MRHRQTGRSLVPGTPCHPAAPRAPLPAHPHVGMALSIGTSSPGANLNHWTLLAETVPTSGTESSVCVRHWAKYFVCVILFNPHNSLLREVLLLVTSAGEETEASRA